MGSLLNEILDQKHREVAALRGRWSVAELNRAAEGKGPCRSLVARITAPGGPTHRIIAEIKRASPSKGSLRENLDPVGLAREYADAGAVGISVLTEGKYFRGSIDDLGRIRGHVSVPVVRKDFLIDPFQIYEARAYGADVVLLILRILEDGLFKELMAAAAELGMEALVEVHDEKDLERALMGGAGLVGVNNRDLYDFSVDISVTERLLPLIPPGIVIVSASGISSPLQVRRLARQGAHAFLVGECLVKAQRPGEKLRELAL